mgnify:CR=1 FL=1
MAEESENSQEKTEDPTPKRLEDSREKGQVPRSRELTAMLVMMTGAVYLLVFGGWMVNGVGNIMAQLLQIDRAVIMDHGNLSDYFRLAVAEGIKIVLPIMAVLLIATLSAPTLIGGWSFSMDAVQPKLSKMNPVSGLGRMFGPKAAVELVKAAGKFGVVALVAGGFLWSSQDRFVALGSMPMPGAMFEAGSLVALSFLMFTVALIFIALIDVPFQLWDHQQKLKMTKQEVKDESKDTEGKPEIKRKIREMQQEVSRRRMMEEVPKADVIVTNPQHYAVALRYEPVRSGAPRVVAKGVDRIALRIRETGIEHEVPILEAPPLARALHANTELGDEIPARLYRAVAEVLSWVYQVRRQRHRGGPPPIRPSPKVDPDPDAN